MFFRNIVLVLALALSAQAASAMTPRWDFESLDEAGHIPMEPSILGLNLELHSGGALDPDIYARGASALRLDPGQVQHLSLPDHPLLNPRRGLSLCVWLYPLSWEGSPRILQKGSPGQGYGVFVDGGMLCFEVGAGRVEAPLPPVDAWVHLVATFDGTSLKIFYNGEAVAGQAFFAAFPSSRSPLYLGGGQPGFDGWIDLLEVMPQAMEPQAIAAAVAPKPPPRALWTFNEPDFEGLGEAYQREALAGILKRGATRDPDFSAEGSGAVRLGSLERQYLEFADHPNLNPESGLTLATWVFPDNWNALRPIFHKGDPESPAYSLFSEWGELVFQVGDTEVAAPLPNAWQWIHVAATCDTETMTLYINGEATTSTDSPVDGFPQSTAPLFIGTRDPAQPLTGHFFSGWMDYLEILPAAVDAAAIAHVAGKSTPSAPPAQPANLGPAAESLDAVTAAELPLEITLSGTDPEDDLLDFTITTAPLYGTLSGSGPNWIYEPDPGFFGTDSFSYTTTDGPLVSDPATVGLLIEPSQAFDQAIEIDEDTPIWIQLQGSDPADRPLAFTLVDTVQHGVLNPDFPLVQYIPALHYHGPDAFQFTANVSEPATVSIEVLPVPDPPEGIPDSFSYDPHLQNSIILDVLPNDSDPDGDIPSLASIDSPPGHGTAEIIDGSIQYTPDATYGAGDSFTYILTDGALLSEPVTVTLTNPGHFSVSDFGATGAGEFDDTTAIQATIDAASVYSGENGAATVFFPEGTYKVMPPGVMSGTVHQKQGGSWVELGPLEDGQEWAGWVFGTGIPLMAPMEEQLAYVDISTGEIYRPDQESWILSEYSIPKQTMAEGWFSGYDPPNDGAGINGDLYIEYHTVFTNASLGREAVFRLTPEQNGITIKGDSKNSSIISFYCWGDIHPMDYSVDTDSKSVLSAKIPRNSNGAYVRGRLFFMDRSPSTPYTGITWSNIQLDGNTVYNGKHGFNGNYNALEEWDVTHKAIFFPTGNTADSLGFLVENCVFLNWRGEVIYKGGENIAEIQVRDTEINGANSSAISISGNVTIQNCLIYNVYNGIENYALPGQFTVVENTTFSDIKDYGVAFIGEPGTFLTVIDSTFERCGFSGIFLSEFSYNVEISNNTFIDSRALYAVYLNQYNKSFAFENILFSNNTITALSKNLEDVVLSYMFAYPMRNWDMTNNTVSAAEGFKVNFFYRLPKTGPWEDFQNIIIEDNILNTGILNFGSPTSDYGLRPLMRNNTVTQQPRPVIVPVLENNSPFVLYLHNPSTPIGKMNGNDGDTISIGGIDLYPEEFITSFFRNATDASTKGVEFPPADWNTFTRGYMLYEGAELTIEFNADGKFDLVSYTPRTGTPLTLTTGPDITVRGFDAVTLAPASATAFSTFSGVPENHPIVIHINEHVVFEPSATLETPDGLTWQPGIDASVTATKQNNVLILQPLE